MTLFRFDVRRGSGLTVEIGVTMQVGMKPRSSVSSAAEGSFGSLTTRRAFLQKSSTAAITGVMAANLGLPRLSAVGATETLRIGLIGCGGRGTGAANNALNADPNVKLVAMADVFEDRLESSRKNLLEQHPDKVQVDPDHRFVGLDAYQKLIHSGVDVVLLATPPGFRPYHLKAAVGAGKHVFCEKPMAVDGSGVRMVLEVAAQAKAKKLSLVSGFCWRYNYGERALMDRIHTGQIGEIRAIYNTYNTGSIWVHPRQPEWNDMHYQLRNWYYFTWLSGDHIVEQACHSLDKMAWAMQNETPSKCVAHGGRQVRTGQEYGHIFDHFSVVYDYPNGAKGFHYSRQQPGCANDNSDTFFGTKGIATIKTFGPLVITGETNWRFRGDRPNMYQVEHDELFASIRSGNPINDGVWMANSTLLAIMGRMAAYTGQEVTWEQAINSKANLAKEVMGQTDQPGDPVFLWESAVEEPPVAMPGKTPLV